MTALSGQSPPFRGVLIACFFSGLNCELLSFILRKKKPPPVVQHHWADKYSVTEAGIFGGVRRGGCYNPASPSLLPHHVAGWFHFSFHTHPSFSDPPCHPGDSLSTHPSIRLSIPAHCAGTTTTLSSLLDIPEFLFVSDAIFSARLQTRRGGGGDARCRVMPICFCTWGRKGRRRGKKNRFHYVKARDDPTVLRQALE